MVWVTASERSRPGNRLQTQHHMPPGDPTEARRLPPLRAAPRCLLTAPPLKEAAQLEEAGRIEESARIEETVRMEETIRLEERVRVAQSAVVGQRLQQHPLLGRDIARPIAPRGERPLANSHG